MSFHSNGFGKNKNNFKKNQLNAVYNNLSGLNKIETTPLSLSIPTTTISKDMTNLTQKANINSNSTSTGFSKLINTCANKSLYRNIRSIDDCIGNESFSSEYLINLINAKYNNHKDYIKKNESLTKYLKENKLNFNYGKPIAGVRIHLDIKNDCENIINNMFDCYIRTIQNLPISYFNGKEELRNNAILIISKNREKYLTIYKLIQRDDFTWVDHTNPYDLTTKDMFEAIRFRNLLYPEDFMTLINMEGNHNLFDAIMRNELKRIIGLPMMPYKIYDKFEIATICGMIYYANYNIECFAKNNYFKFILVESKILEIVEELKSPILQKLWFTLLCDIIEFDRLSIEYADTLIDAINYSTARVLEENLAEKWMVEKADCYIYRTYEGMNNLELLNQDAILFEKNYINKEHISYCKMFKAILFLTYKAIKEYTPGSYYSIKSIINNYKIPDLQYKNNENKSFNIFE